MIASFRSSRLALLILAAVSGGCASAPALSRTPDARDLPRATTLATPAPPQAHALWAEAQAVFERRCVVCHGCYDAPCQLKLESFAGAERGANVKPVYDGARLTAADPTRLSIDARLVSEWRHKGFHAVLPDAARPDPKHSVLSRMLELKRAHPLVAGTNLNEAFTWGLDREQTCPKAEEFDAYAKDHPLWGMPYALPALTDAEHAALQRWLEGGAPAPEPPQLSAALAKQVADWEGYFNEPTNKRRLIARYIYEHLFLASLYFRGADGGTFFRLVRSRTPPGFPVDEIATRRPFEDPGPGEFYYRFVRNEGPRLAKTHMPYALDAARRERYRVLFDAPEYAVDALPSYEPKVAANPLSAFAALPVRSRHRFMLDDAEFSLMNFIKGPVCRGQVALNVIQERFWVLFVDPDVDFSEYYAGILKDLRSDLVLPAEAGSNAWPTRWYVYANAHADYVRRKNAIIAEAARGKPGLTLDLVWNGEGGNANAALTVLRHFDSATVVQGLVGGVPKTAWIIDYPMFERIHYLLVAGFDVFGNVGHQLLTRMYMDFLRMEGEANFLALLPRARRRELERDWYRGVEGEARQRVATELAGLGVEPRIRYRTARPELELYALLERRVAAVRSTRFDLPEADPLRALQDVPGEIATLFPELSFLAVEGGERTRYYTIVRDSAHTNVAELFFEDARRVPKEDVLRVVPGFLGAYPNTLFRVRAADLAEFVREVSQLDELRYGALRERYGLLRTSPDFWIATDAMHAAQRESGPPDAGLFDYNRLQPD